MNTFFNVAHFMHALAYYIVKLKNSSSVISFYIHKSVYAIISLS